MQKYRHLLPHARAMAEVVDQALGQALRKLRTERGWSQTELALRAGMDRNYLSLIELGRNSPSVRMLLRLCQALDMSAAEVLADAERRMALLELDEGLSGPGQQDTLP